MSRPCVLRRCVLGLAVPAPWPPASAQQPSAQLTETAARARRADRRAPPGSRAAGRPGAYAPRRRRARSKSSATSRLEEARRLDARRRRRSAIRCRGRPGGRSQREGGDRAGPSGPRTPGWWSLQAGPAGLCAPAARRRQTCGHRPRDPDGRRPWPSSTSAACRRSSGSWRRLEAETRQRWAGRPRELQALQAAAREAGVQAQRAALSASDCCIREIDDQRDLNAQMVGELEDRADACSACSHSLPGARAPRPRRAAASSRSAARSTWPAAGRIVSRFGRRRRRPFRHDHRAERHRDPAADGQARARPSTTAAWRLPTSSPASANSSSSTTAAWRSRSTATSHARRRSRGCRRARPAGRGTVGPDAGRQPVACTSSCESTASRSIPYNG